MINAWNIYWIMQLDSIIGLFILLTIASSVGSVISFIIFMCNVSGYDSNEDYKNTAARLLKWFVPLAMFGAMCITFIPSTKTAAAMVVVPAIANNENVQREAGELYQLAKDALKEAINPPKQENK